MSFTQPCFIRKNTPELRGKLTELGYRVLPDIFNFPCLSTTAEGLAIPSDELNRDGAYDCGENEYLFLTLANMRDDTDEGQFFVFTENYRVKGANIVYEKGYVIRVNSGKVSDISFPLRKMNTLEIVKYLGNLWPGHERE